MACSCCGADEILVFSGILEGNLCTNCYDKYIKSGAMNKVKQKQKEVFDYLNKAGLTKLFMQELKRVHKNFLVEPVPTVFEVWANGGNFNAMFNMKYRGKSALLLFTKHVDNKGNAFLGEYITYACKNRSASQVERRIYPDGRVVNCKTVNLLKQNKEKRYIKIVTGEDEYYIIESKSGNVIEGYVKLGDMFQKRWYGKSDDWKFIGPASARHGATRLESMKDFVEYLDRNSTNPSERRELLLYKNGNCKYNIQDIDHGTVRIHGGQRGGIKNAYFVESLSKSK